MNLSTTASTVSVDMNDQVVDIWPQVSHTVHVWIGVFLGVSGRLHVCHARLATLGST